MRIRHAVIAGSAVAAMSAATTLMASSQAAASVHTPAVAPVATSVATSSFGSVAGLLLGLLLVLGVAAVSFTLRLRVAGPGARRTLVLPEPVAAVQTRSAVSFCV